VTNDDCDPVWVENLRYFEDMKKKRFTAEAVQYFGHIRFHPGALACRQDYDAEFSHFRALFYGCSIINNADFQ
jgi:hypothetical protein